MSSKKDKIINILLIVVYILTLAVIIFLTKSNVFKKDSVEEEVDVIVNSDFEKYEVKDLETKMKKFSFASKKQDFIQGDTTINSSISNGEVRISIKVKSTKKEYTVPEIKDAKSIGTYLVTSDGIHITYVLTESGLVYKIKDDLKEVSESENHVGSAVDLGIVKADSIAIDHKLTNTLLEDKTRVKPFVYIKTQDGRYFTDEELVEGKDIVELIEKKEEAKEEANENTSES